MFVAFPVNNDRGIFCQLLKYSNFGGIESFHIFRRVEMELGSLDVSILGDVIERGYLNPFFFREEIVIIYPIGIYCPHIHTSVIV